VVVAERPERFEVWEKGVHSSLRNDPLWDFKVYPKALFLYDLTWFDCEQLLRDERGQAVARQLIRSAGAISANIEEGFGRGYGPDYAYRLRIAMGEARETRGWYWRSRHLLSEEVLVHRLKLLDEIIAMLAPSINRVYQHGRNKK
jgi:four helix bundle protein